MSHYIQELQAYAAAERERQASQVQQAEADAARDKLRPLADRLTILLASIPPSVAAEGLSLEALRTLLRGRQGGACSSAELGPVLRRLGWKRVRRWRGSAADGAFAALWHPPGSA